MYIQSKNINMIFFSLVRHFPQISLSSFSAKILFFVHMDTQKKK